MHINASIIALVRPPQSLFGQDIFAHDLTGALDTAAVFAGPVPVYIDRPPADQEDAAAPIAALATGTRDVAPASLPERLQAALDWLRAGTVAGGNGMGIFVRLPGGEIKHLYGPSPDQIFRRWRREQAPNISVMLAQAYASQLRYELTGSRKA